MKAVIFAVGSLAALVLFLFATAEVLLQVISPRKSRIPFILSVIYFIIFVLAEAWLQAKLG